MKFTCLQENLLKGLQIAKQSGIKYTSLPILQNYLLQESSGTLTISSTNLEIGIKVYVRGKEEGEGQIAIAQERFLTYIKNLPQDKIHLSLEETTLQVRSGEGFTADFHGVDPTDFPPFPTIDQQHTLILGLSDFKQALKLASISLPKNDFRPEISGVYLARKGQSLLFVGTDGFRLSEKKLQLPTFEELDFGYIIPTKAVSEYIRILDLIDSEEIQITFGENQMMLITSEVEIISKLVEGTFPQYEGLIPTHFERSFSVDKHDLVQAIRLSSVFSADSVNDIKFVIQTPGQLSVRSTHSEIGSNDSQIRCELTGDPGFEITFNYSYILEGLASLTGDVITFQINDADSPAILRGTEDPDHFYLVMPIRE